MAEAKEEQAELERIRLREAPTFFGLQFAVLLGTFHFALYPGNIDLGTRTSKGHALSWLRKSLLMLHPLFCQAQERRLMDQRGTFKVVGSDINGSAPRQRCAQVVLCVRSILDCGI